jgi:dTDP-4-amino-4,6-dideoxygalactose transaminase
MKPEMRVPFAKVVCDGDELACVREVIESGWLTTAGKCLEFESRMASIVDVTHACAVNSCTAALHLAAEAAGIGPGDLVLVPTLTFTATAEVLRYLGADPVFADVEYGTALLTPGIVRQALDRCQGLKAVMIVHFGGHAADVDQIVPLCRERGVRVIEDAAHAFPSRLNGRMIGSHGDAVCFSFYANKTITTGEGGMLVTNDAALYRRAKVMRLHGIDRDIWHRFRTPGASWEYDVVAPGFKYNMPDINAAIGLAQLDRAYALRERRQACAEYYYANLADEPFLDLPVCRVPHEDHAWHLFWVVLHDDAPLSRDAFVRALNVAGIGTSVHYKPLHRMTYYRDRYKLTPADFPHAERHWRGCVSLPLFPTMTEAELEYVCRTVKAVLHR